MRRLLIAAIVLAATACQAHAPLATDLSMLGPDADDPYFLARFRSCAAFASYTYCQAEMYGGLPQ